MPDLSIIIVNFNSGTMLSECLESVFDVSKSDAVNVEIIVVDNASTDQSIAETRKRFPYCKYVLSDSNLGFAKACNLGAKDATSECFLFLNPDSVLKVSSLARPYGFLCDESNSKVGICGVDLLSEDGRPSTVGANFPKVRIFLAKIFALNKFFPVRSLKHLLSSDYSEPVFVVDQVIGAFFMIRRDLFVKLKGFDEDFFVYYEEVDLSFRAKREGYSSVVLTDVSAVHIGGGCSDKVKALRIFYSLRSRFIFSKKHFSMFGVISMFILAYLEYFLRILKVLLKGDMDGVSEVIKSFRYYICWNFQSFLKKYNSK